MSLNYNLYLKRANNEIILAKVLIKISEDENLKLSIFELKNNETFYNAVISHSYYTIFYTAKAYLLNNNIKVSTPEEHKKTYEEFKKIVNQGKLDIELLEYYQELIIKAEELLGIFKIEKKKRGLYTYEKLSETNRKPAEISLENARKFFKNIYNLLV